ncbi:hypothetical protein Pmani_010784 [Petrolisthes manimaculis]|uniref:Uncharacterized protein n=1 Tax=Petrolisthes manimaculis TaxID=1843537 RepID=A0AAE1Q1F3_9EUCA|nr:hypothetical protein Pmani_010784 [Petrolisthes manimaculis]
MDRHVSCKEMEERNRYSGGREEGTWWWWWEERRGEIEVEKMVGRPGSDGECTRTDRMMESRGRDMKGENDRLGIGQGGRGLFKGKKRNRGR